MSKLSANDNWIIASGIDSSDWWEIYVYSFYWATTIMMTVGFGDFLPANQDEVIITSFIEIFGCIILSYNISVIGSIISKIRESDEKVRVKMAVF